MVSKDFIGLIIDSQRFPTQFVNLKESHAINGSAKIFICKTETRKFFFESYKKPTSILYLASGAAVNKPDKKRKNLIRLGIDQEHAYAFSRTRKGVWAIAQSPILGSTITLKRLRQKGYQSLTAVYIELKPSFCNHRVHDPYPEISGVV